MSYSRGIVRLLAIVALAGLAIAQDHLRWKQGAAAAGPMGIFAYASSSSAGLWWDPDGAGPSGQVVVFGGQFSIPSVHTNNLAWFDPVREEFGTFSTGPNGAVLALAVLQNGDLVAGGTFSSCGAVPTGPLAVWNGSTWASIGGGVSGPVGTEVRALQVLTNGELVVGGRFAQVGSLAANGLARWNGSQWNLLSGVSVPTTCMALRQNGNLVVGGDFPGTVSEWNGASWTNFVPGLPVVPDAVAVTALDEVVVATAMFGLRWWDGSGWALLGNVAGIVTENALLPLANGDLLVAGVTTVNSVVVNGIARWSGGQWSAYAPDVGGIAWMLSAPAGGVWVGGYPTATPASGARGIGYWDGTALRPATAGFDDEVVGFSAMPNGEVFAHGRFRTAAGQPAFHAARWTGSSWVTMPLPAHNNTSRTCSAVDDMGTLYCVDQSTVYRRSGLGWQPFGTQVPAVSAMAIDANQRLVIGLGSYGYPYQPVRRWNGTAWEALGALDGPVFALLRRSNGDLIAGGAFLFSGSTAVAHIARWDGTAWQPIGTGFDGAVRALAELPNGDLVAGGDFVSDSNFALPLNHVARWDGTAWHWFANGIAGNPLGSVRALLVLANGDLVVGGDFGWAGTGVAKHIARWNGVAWSELDGGCDGPVSALAQAGNGDVFVGGEFGQVGGKASAHLGRLRTDAPASVAAFGGNCASSSAVLTLESATLPWLGATVRGEAFGVPTVNTFGIVVTGTVQAQVPLASLHPAGVSGCDLLASPDAIALAVPSGGVVTATLPLPRTPALIGTELFQQVLVVEVGSGGAIQRLAGTNGLRLQIGSL